MSDALLRDAPRCVLGFAGARGPLLSPMAFWSDGAALWMSTSSSSVKARRLGEDTTCAVWIPPRPSAGQDRGLIIDGRARVFSLDDPVGIATHWVTLSAAMTALAVKNAASMVGYARDLPWLPARWLPTSRVVVRVRMERVRPVAPPRAGPGIAPALPQVVPPDVRRVLAGERRVVVAAGAGRRLWLAPAVWGAGYTLDLGEGAEPPVPDGTPVVAALDADPQSRPSQVLGLAVHGRLEAGPRLAPERATWWRGFDVSGAEIPQRPAGGIVLPD